MVATNAREHPLASIPTSFSNMVFHHTTTAHILSYLRIFGSYTLATLVQHQIIHRTYPTKGHEIYHYGL
jgi:hypothetical protein